MSRQGQYAALLGQGRQHLNEWYQHIQGQWGEENPEPWFQYNSFGHFSLAEDYVDFSYLGKRYRLQLKVESETGEGFIELWEMHSNKSTDEGGKIWELCEHIENMDVVYRIGLPLQFKTARQPRVIGGMSIPLQRIDRLHKTYCLEFDKETEFRASGTS